MRVNRKGGSGILLRLLSLLVIVQIQSERRRSGYGQSTRSMGSAARDSS